MSAYMIDRNHLRFLVTAAQSYGLVGTMPPTEFGQLLWDENIKSIKGRYPDTIDDFSNAPGPTNETFVYEHVPFVGPIEPAQVLKSITCYMYQACEHDEWKDSTANKICVAMASAAKHQMTPEQFENQDDAIWGAPPSLDTAEIDASLDAASPAE